MSKSYDAGILKFQCRGYFDWPVYNVTHTAVCKQP